MVFHTLKKAAKLMTADVRLVGPATMERWLLYRKNSMRGKHRTLFRQLLHIIAVKKLRDNHLSLYH